MTTLSWSGYNWIVKAGSGQPPGNNNWSDSPSDVFVDTQGRLHLKISNYAGAWYCTEIISADTLGYGTYTFNVSPVNIDANVVLGMFTYLDDTHEIDTEISKWGNPSDTNNIGYTVQPQIPGQYNQYNTHRFYIPLTSPTSNSFTWIPNSVDFLSKTQTTSEPWSSTVYVPQSSTEKVHINLWLYQGNPPQNGLAQEVIIDNFTFDKSLYNLIPSKNTAIIIAAGLIFLLILKTRRTE